MTNKTWGILLAIGAILFFTVGMTAGYFAFRCTTDGKVVIEKKYLQGPTVYVNNPPAKCGDLNIDGCMTGNKFRATCGDKCKSSFRDFDMGIITKQKNYHVIQAGYGPLYDINTNRIRHSVDATYLYSWPNVALGAGAFAVFDNKRLYDIGPRIIIQGRIPDK